MDPAPTSTLVVFSLVAAVERHLNAYAAIAADDAAHRFSSSDSVPDSLLEGMSFERQRLLRIDVQRGARDAFFLERGEQRELIDERTARDVHEEGRGFHGSQLAHADETSRRRIENGMQRDEVALGKHVAQI